MNVLEENGVKVNVEGKVDGVEEEDSEYYSMEYSLNDYLTVNDYLTESYITPIEYADNKTHQVHRTSIGLMQ